MEITELDSIFEKMWEGEHISDITKDVAEGFIRYIGNDHMPLDDAMTKTDQGVAFRIGVLYGRILEAKGASTNRLR